MKVNLVINQKGLHGYTVIDPCGGEGKIVAHPLQLEGIVEPASCTEFVAEDILDYLPANQLMNTLKYYTSKLRHKGVLIIGGTDLYMVAKNIITQRLNIVEANEMLYGKRESAWDIKSGEATMQAVVDILSSFGLKINKKRINGVKFVVECERV